MTLINLLPWRIEHLQIKNNIFYFMAVVTIASSIIIIFFAKTYIERLRINERWNIKYLNAEIVALQDQIKEIKGLKGQKELLIARSTVIQSLQASRPFVVKLFDNMARVVPKGLHLTKVVREGNSLTIEGLSDSNAKVSLFMKKLGNLEWLKNASLTEIKTKILADESRSIEFLVEASF
jgi:type IV pilus assembly protein PilN